MIQPDMQRYVAFLRAINVGGRTIKMDQLRDLFQQLGLSNVETFIASGNVIFDTAEDRTALEQRISDHLHAQLGYQAEAFVRSTGELAEIAACQPFPEHEYTENGATLHIIFTPGTINAQAEAAVLGLRTAKDDFHVRGSEVYWLIRGKMSDSLLKGSEPGKVLGAPVTVRNVNTVRRLVKKYPPTAAVE